MRPQTSHTPREKLQHMRLRNIPQADAVIAASPYCIKNAAAIRGGWHNFLENDRPIHLEIGMGKGRFLMDMAALHPQVNYIGVERYTSVLLRAVQKMDELLLPNVHFLCEDAANLPEIFGKDEVEHIYLNFSDPWPKARHSHRRLTSRAFLDRYARFLSADGRLEFKTDNQELFDFSLEEIELSGTWQLDACTRDLHHDPELSTGNIMTEYEEKFSAMGHPICKLAASRRITGSGTP